MPSMDHKPSRWKQFLFSDREPQFNPYVVPRVDPSEEAVALRRQKWAEFQLIEPVVLNHQSKKFLEGVDPYPTHIREDNLALFLLTLGISTIVVIVATILCESVFVFVSTSFLACYVSEIIVGPKYARLKALNEKGKITLVEIDQVKILNFPVLINPNHEYWVCFHFNIPDGPLVKCETMIRTPYKIKPGSELVVLYLDEENYWLL